MNHAMLSSEASEIFCDGPRLDPSGPGVWAPLYLHPLGDALALSLGRGANPVDLAGEGSSESWLLT